MGYAYSYNGAIEDMMENVLAMGSALSGFSSLLNLAAYVFTALALYTIANRRGIRHAWMAWVPVLDVWILGSISDQFRYVVKGENKSKRKILLALSVICAVTTIVFIVMLLGIVGGLIMAAVQGADPDQVAERALGSIMSMLGGGVVILILSIVKMIVSFMALYDLYTSCDPHNNVLYLVLSIIPMVSTIAQPVILFLCREKDEGMPPRRTEPAYDAPPANWYEESLQGKREWNSASEDPSEPWNQSQE